MAGKFRLKTASIIGSVFGLMIGVPFFIVSLTRGDTIPEAMIASARVAAAWFCLPVAMWVVALMHPWLGLGWKLISRIWSPATALKDEKNDRS